MNPATRQMIARLSELAERGMTYAEAAKEIDGTYAFVASYARRYSIPLRQLPRGRSRVTSDARSADMQALYESGETLVQIGQKYGITRERVRQIMTKYHGTRAKDGGKIAAVRKKRAAFSKKRDERTVRRWGCSFKTYRQIVKHEGKPTYAFSQQRKNAQQRDIPWEMSLAQWWSIWEKSGHWSERGRGKGYCMCRLNDVGPYAVDNVYIATGNENIQDYWVNKRAADLEVARMTFNAPLNAGPPDVDALAAEVLPRSVAAGANNSAVIA